jgi:hypothetical protein
MGHLAILLMSMMKVIVGVDVAVGIIDVEAGRLCFLKLKISTNS